MAQQAQFTSVRAVASRLKSQFKVDMDIYEITQACADILKKMGFIALERSVFFANVDNFIVNMPGNIWKVRGVVRLDGSPAPPIPITLADIAFPPQVVFKMTEPAPGNTQAIMFESNYVPQFKGPYIDYVWDAPLLKFNETDIPVAIECTGIALDEEGFPEIPEEAFYGCLYYALYVYYQPLFLLGQISPQVWKEVEQWKERNVAQANHSTLMSALTANEKDKLFDILVSMDRKSTNLPI